MTTSIYDVFILERNFVFGTSIYDVFYKVIVKFLWKMDILLGWVYMMFSKNFNYFPKGLVYMTSFILVHPCKGAFTNYVTPYFGI